MSTAMIWGASGGIGRALGARLVAEGWTLIAASRHPEALVDLTPHAIAADASDDFQVRRAMLEASQICEAIDLWVYAAGDIGSAKAADMPPADFQRILGANLGGAWLAAHHALPQLADDAHLVFLGAVSERMRLPGLTAYAAAKAGLEAMTETLAKEVRGRRVTLVRPGAVATTFWDKVPFRLPAEALTPDQVAEAILEAHRGGHKGRLDLSPASG